MGNDAEIRAEISRLKLELRRRQRNATLEIGMQLFSLRERRGLSQKAVAIKCHITQAAVSLAESGKRPAMARKLIRQLSKVIP